MTKTSKDERMAEETKVIEALRALDAADVVIGRQVPAGHSTKAVLRHDHTQTVDSDRVVLALRRLASRGKIQSNGGFWTLAL